jgi:dephospho-CoA kinase
MTGSVPFILGLTGSIGMGKTTAAQNFRLAGVPVFDADCAVASLYEGDAVSLIERAFPGTIKAGKVDRDTLADAVLTDSAAFGRLEAIVHPLVRSRERDFLEGAAGGGARLAVLDIPLLFETRGEGRCDAVAVVSAPPAIQRERVLGRAGMTEQRFDAILARQMPDEEKRRRAHFLIDTSRDHAAAARQVSGIIRALAGRPTRQLAPPTDDADA